MVEEKVEPGRIALWVSIVALSSISFLLILGSASIAVDDRDREAYLIVEQVYFESEEVGDDTYDLIVKAYVTNDGDKGADVRVSAFAIDIRTNIVFDSSSDDLGRMEGRTTKRADMSVQIDSQRKYMVEVIVYKDGKVVVRGSGTVDLALAGVGGEDYRTTETDVPRGGGESLFNAPAEAAKGVPFPALAALLPALLAFAILMRRWKR